MEFTPTQLSHLNLILPSKYHLDLPVKLEPRPSKPSRKSEAESLSTDIRFLQKPAEKRPQPEPLSSPAIDPRIKSSDFFKKLSKIISDLKKHEKFPIFSSATELKSKDLFSLFTVESKLNTGRYSSAYDFAMDIRKIWNSSFSSNPGNQELYSATVDLSVRFEELMRGNENLVLEELKKGQETEKPVKNVLAAKVETNKKVPDKPLGFMEKKLLCQNIKKLEPKYLKGLLDIVKECMDMKGEEMEFDIERLPPKVCRELDRYVKQCLANSSKSKKKNTVEQIKHSQKETSAKISQLENQIENVSNAKIDVDVAQDSESESSSTSESEEEVPNAGFLNRDEDQNDFPGFGQMVDFDKIY